MNKIELLRMFFEDSNFLLIAFIIILAAVVVDCILGGSALYNFSGKLGLKNKGFCFIPFLNKLMLGKIAEKISDKREEKTFKAAKPLFISYIASAIALLILAVVSFFALTTLLAASYEAVKNGDELSASAFNLFIYVIILYFIALAVTALTIGLKAVCSYKIFLALQQKNAKAKAILSAIIPLFSAVALFLTRKKDI